MKVVEMVGKKFGRLTVTERAGSNHKGNATWRCICDCGNECVVCGVYLRNGTTKSCGCLWYDAIRDANSTYGEYNTRLRHIWQGIKNRCYNENELVYRYYGGKGVKIQENWKDFLTFKSWAISNGYKDNLTIDRINPDGDYCEENCRWVSMKEQCNNRTNNVLIESNGETKTLAQWAELSELTYKQVWHRYHYLGWDIQKALYTPIRGGKKNV